MMISVKFIGHDGSEHSVEVEAGMTVMEGAALNMVPGVEGMCGGLCSCGTCHCYIRGEWGDRISAPSSGEVAMLEGVEDRRPESRLGCQIRLTQDLNGLEVLLPKSQGIG